MRALGGVKLLILDDWGLEPLGPDVAVQRPLPDQRLQQLQLVPELDDLGFFTGRKDHPRSGRASGAGRSRKHQLGRLVD